MSRLRAPPAWLGAGLDAALQCARRALAQLAESPDDAGLLEVSAGAVHAALGGARMFGMGDAVTSLEALQPRIEALAGLAPAPRARACAALSRALAHLARKWRPAAGGHGDPPLTSRMLTDAMREARYQLQRLESDPAACVEAWDAYGRACARVSGQLDRLGQDWPRQRLQAAHAAVAATLSHSRVPDPAQLLELADVWLRLEASVRTAPAASLAPLLGVSGGADGPGLPDYEVRTAMAACRVQMVKRLHIAAMGLGWCGAGVDAGPREGSGAAALVREVAAVLHLLEWPRPAVLLETVERWIEAAGNGSSGMSPAEGADAVADVLAAVILCLGGAGDPGRDPGHLLEHAERRLAALSVPLFPAGDDHAGPPRAPSVDAAAAGMSPVMDTVLLEVLRSEIGAHLHTLRACLARAEQAPVTVDASLMRAVHTLHGAAAMVELSPLLLVLAPLENYLRYRSDIPAPLPEPGVRVLAETADFIEHVAARLDTGAPLDADATHLVERLQALQDIAPAATGAPSPADTAETADDLTSVPQLAPVRVSESAGIDADLLRVFIGEGRELLDHADGVLAQWRDDPGRWDCLDPLQRDLHTFKGGARMCGLASPADLAHAMESLLDVLGRVRRVDGPVLVALEHGVDGLHRALHEAASGGAVTESAAAVAHLEALAARLADTRITTHDRGGTTDGEASAVAEDAQVRLPRHDAIGVSGGTGESTAQEPIRVRAGLLDRLVNEAGEVSILRSRLAQQISDVRLGLGELERTVGRLREQLRPWRAASESFPADASRRAPAGGATRDTDAVAGDRSLDWSQTSRALAESLDDLVSLHGLLDAHARQSELLLQQQARVGSGMQEALMRTRMVAFESVVPALRRSLRQVAREAGKRARLHVLGAEGEMDRGLLERMAAPLQHMLRNAVVHGLEAPAARRAAGKPDEGVITLQVSREAGDVLIRFSDDGAGMDRAAIRRRAIQRGQLADDAVVPDQALFAFVLEHGFSTAPTVSQLAGRGVGMDVVASEIARMGGSLHIDSVAGRGTTFTTRVPFTLAVTRAVWVRAGASLFAVPMASIRGVARLPQALWAAFLADQDKCFEHAGERYDLYDMAALVGLPSVPVAAQARPPVLLLRSDDLRAAVRVEHVLGAREIVVKPAGPQVSSVPGMLGATVTGDGAVVMILDPATLLRHGRTRAGRRRPVAPDFAAARRPLPVSVLVVDDSITMRQAARRVLAQHDYDVRTARDGMDAVEQLQRHVPDLVLTDIEMPRMDGYELVTYMKNDARLVRVPVIVVSSRGGEGHRRKARELGVDGYLRKPYRDDALLAQVGRVLAARHE